jgi:hypothetical protein
MWALKSGSQLVASPSRDPEEPAAHISDYLALLPSGPDAFHRLRLHRIRAALRPVTTLANGGPRSHSRRSEDPQSIPGSGPNQAGPPPPPRGAGAPNRAW